MTLRKTLIGALTALLLLAGFSSQALAQENTDTTTTDTTDTTTTDTTSTDTTDTTTTDTTDTTTTDTTTTDGQGEANIGESFETTDTPNPQPSEALPAPADAAAAEDPAVAPSAADQVAGETQLAYTGPDTRIIALAMLLLGAGFVFAVASRRQELRLAEVDSWLE